MSRAEQLRPFADAPCPRMMPLQPGGPPYRHMVNTAEVCSCHGTGLDPLYEGLRYWRLDDAASWEDWQSRDIYRVRRVSASNTATMVCDVRTDVGSVLRAADVAGVGADVSQAILDWMEARRETRGELEDAVAARFAAAVPVPERAS